MKTSKYQTDPDTVTQVERIERGDITRAQAAEEAGVSVSSFNTRLKRGGFTDRLKTSRDYSAGHFFRPDPDKAKVYAEAVAQSVSAPKLKVTALLREFPTLNYQVLARKVRAARFAPETLEDAVANATIKALRAAIGP